MNIKATFVDRDPVPRPTTPPAAANASPGSCAAKNLALAYKLEGLIERGLVIDYTAAAELLGVSQPRLTHVMAMRLLAPAVQEAILFDELAFGDKELRTLARIADWNAQAAAVAARTAPRQSRRPRSVAAKPA
jgi:predicted XRE-type DNA-binding protein